MSTSTSSPFAWIKHVDPIATAIALVGTAYAVTFQTVDQVSKLLGNWLGASIFLTVLYVFLSRVCYVKIYHPSSTLTYSQKQRTKKQYKRLFRVGTTLYVIGIAWVIWGCQWSLQFFPKSTIGIMVNTVEGDNDDRQIKKGIIFSIDQELNDDSKVELETVDLDLDGGSDDKTDIIRKFTCDRYCKGIFTNGIYRAEDATLSGKIYMHNLPLDSSNRVMIILDNPDSIKVEVTKKTELFGAFIVALLYQRRNEPEKSNALINKILADSIYLRPDFRYQCHRAKSINFSLLDKNAEAEDERDKAVTFQEIGNNCSIDTAGGFYILRHNGTTDTIKEFCDNVRILPTSPGFESAFTYKGYALFRISLYDDEFIHYHIVKCGGTYRDIISLEPGTITHYIDSIVRLNKQ